ncbi:MAG: hypothetical protein ACFE9C_18755 [Candidatus Hodarchaeota archaeon]
MNPIPPRKILKQLIFFAKREFKEKKPLAAEVLSVKSEQYLSKGGPLKELSIRRVVGAYYLVMVEYKEEVRIYYYSRNGELIDAKNVEIGSKVLKDLQKSTVREFHIPSKN